MRSISARSDGQPLDERVGAERDDPRHVLVLLLGQRLAEVGERLLAAGRADRVRQVDDEHDRQPVDRQHELEPGQGADEGRKQQRRGPRAPPVVGPCPAGASTRGGARSRPPGAAAAAGGRWGRRTRCPSGAPPGLAATGRGGPPRPGGGARACRARRPATRWSAGRGRRARSGSTARRGRSGARRACRRPPAPVPAGCVPRAVSFAGSPGRDHRLVDVEQVDGEPGRGRRPRPGGRSARRGARRRRSPAARTPSRRRPGDDPPDGAGRGVLSRRAGVTVYTPSRSVRANVTLAAPARRRDQLVDAAVRAAPRERRAAPSGTGSVTGEPGATASTGVSEPPISSPARLASRTGNATWSGRSEWRGSNARTAAGPAVERAGVEQRRARRARDHRPRPGRQLQLLRLADVDGGEVDVAEDRVGRVERADARVRERPGDACRGPTSAAARSRASAWPAASAAGSG